MPRERLQLPKSSEPLARATLVFGPGLERARFRRIGSAPLVLGRDPGPDGFSLPGEEASRRHAALRWDGGPVVEDLGSTNGTFLNGARVTRAPAPSGSVLRLGDCLIVVSALPADAPVLGPVSGEEGFADRSLGLEHAELVADRAAPSALPVLIVGPTGAGKERLAERIHARSRRKGPLVAANCAGFPPGLLSSELFGHVEGAFTGSSGRRLGLFAAADGGTLFLDEIAELPLEQQAALLRALQEKRIRPVGGDREVPVDVRVVAATHADLPALAAQGGFRSDLLARLDGVRVSMPGLADRPEDVLRLVVEHLAAHRGTVGEALGLDAAEALLLYRWPRNVREVQRVAAHVGLFIEGSGPVPSYALPGFLRPQTDSAPGRAKLEALLEAHRGNVCRIAAELSAHRTQVHRWLKASGLDAGRYRKARLS